MESYSMSGFFYLAYFCGSSILYHVSVKKKISKTAKAEQLNIKHMAGN